MKQSAGLVIYRKRGDDIEVLLVHPGGPFWAKKDKGAWSIPKGEIETGDTTFARACVEFEEEVGQPPPNSEPIELGEIRQKSGKIVRAWAMEGDLDASKAKSNTFPMEWPPRSGKIQEFPEVDRAEWFDLSTAATKLLAGQAQFLQRLAEHLGINSPATTIPEQPSLF